MMPFPKVRRASASSVDFEETTTIQVRKGEFQLLSGTFESSRAAPPEPEAPTELSVSDFQLADAPPPPSTPSDEFQRIFARELARGLATNPLAAARRAMAMPAVPTVVAAAPAARDSDGYEVTAPRSAITVRSQRRRSGRWTVMAALLLGGLAIGAVAVELAPGRVTHLIDTAASILSAPRR